MITTRQAVSGSSKSSAHAPIGFIEFVSMVAGLMALNALAVDVMLPALQDIGATLSRTRSNVRAFPIRTPLRRSRVRPAAPLLLRLHLSGRPHLAGLPGRAQPRQERREGHGHFRWLDPRQSGEAVAIQPHTTEFRIL